MNLQYEAVRTGRAIGGYFELETSSRFEFPYAEAFRFQSGRAAFMALLAARRPRRVWAPRFICDAMLQPIIESGAQIGLYSLDSRLDIAADLVLGDEDLILYVNYFGLCDDNCARLLMRYRRGQVVLDYSQAFFSPSLPCLATIRSPRKFVGLPDGGLLHTALPIEMPAGRDDQSLGRCVHLLKRLGADAEPGYPDYQEAERSLVSVSPRRMSTLTERMMSGIDFSEVARKRIENFAQLHAALGDFNELPSGSVARAVPLCYPLLVSGVDLRKKLSAERIYTATYWPDIIPRTEQPSLERRLMQWCVALPCDQRYDQSDMQRIITIVLDGLDGLAISKKTE